MYKRPSALLSIDTNAKTVKGQKIGFLTGILYMAPSDLSGVNLCPMADIAGCKAACLNTAGMGGVYPSIQLARINKAKYFIENQTGFMADIVRDILRVIAKAKAKGLIPLIRLNGTTDIRWENIPAIRDGVKYRNVFAAFPDVQFYDYTKIANRKGMPANYDLTFSYSGLPAYQRFVQQAIKAGMRVAVVFRRQADIPQSFIGLPCVDGDNSDVRHLDPQGVVVALYAKGKAKTDTSGFVVDAGARRVIPLMRAA